MIQRDTAPKKRNLPTRTTEKKKTPRIQSISQPITWNARKGSTKVPQALTDLTSILFPQIILPMTSLVCRTSNETRVAIDIPMFEREGEQELWNVKYSFPDSI